MRKIQFGDAFKLARIIKLANLKDALQAKIVAYNEHSKEKTEEEKAKVQSNLGIDIAFTLIESSSTQQVEEQVYELFGGLFDIDPNQVKELEFDELMLKLKKLAEQNNLKDFFKQASRLM